MKKKLIQTGLALLVLFGLLQFTNPARTNPPVKTDLIGTLHPPEAIATSFVHACYDCHSHQTKWPWYAHVAPASWLVANDVNEGRRHLNMSEWPAADPKQAVRRLDAMSEKIGNKEMPPQKYTMIHADARLTDSQRKAMTDWLDAQSNELIPPAK